MEQGLLYLLAGYLSGSVLYARVFSGLLRRGDVTEKSRDGNPGTANAFLYGGFWCGALTLVCELLKGFLPVFLFTKRPPAPPLPGFFSALIIAAPVIGHVFPLFFRFRGGKGIAVTFGCLLGLWPQSTPFWWFAAFFSSFFHGSADMPALLPNYRYLSLHGGSYLADRLLRQSGRLPGDRRGGDRKASDQQGET